MVQAHAVIQGGAFGVGHTRDESRETRRPHPDTLLRNHMEVEGAKGNTASSSIVKLSTDWRTAMIRLALVGGISGQAHAWTTGANVAVVAIAAMVLWSLGRTEGKIARILAIMVAIGGFGYAVVQRGL